MASLIVPAFSAVPSALVILKVGPVILPFSLIVVPPIIAPISDLALYNWPPFTASLEPAATLPSAMLDNLVVPPVVVPSGLTTRASTVVAGFALFNTLPSLSTSAAL